MRVSSSPISGNWPRSCPFCSLASRSSASYLQWPLISGAFSVGKARYGLCYAHELVLGQLVHRIDTQSVLQGLGVVLAQPLDGVHGCLRKLGGLLLLVSFVEELTYVGHRNLLLS